MCCILAFEHDFLALVLASKCPRQPFSLKLVSSGFSGNDLTLQDLVVQLQQQSQRLACKAPPNLQWSHCHRTRSPRHPRLGQQARLAQRSGLLGLLVSPALGGLCGRHVPASCINAFQGNVSVEIRFLRVKSRDFLAPPSTFFLWMFLPAQALPPVPLVSPLFPFQNDL